MLYISHTMHVSYEINLHLFIPVDLLLVGVDISGHVSSTLIAAETALEFSIALISLYATTYM